MSKRNGFLVAISSSPHSEYLIRWTHERASELNERWCAVYIQNEEIGFSVNDVLKKNMNLAVDLGAEVLTAYEDDISRGILRVAVENSLSCIIVGKSQYNKLNIFNKKSNIAEKLIKNSGDIDIIILSDRNFVSSSAKRLFGNISFNDYFDIRQYFQVSLFLSVLILFNLFLHKYISYLSIGFVFLTAVSIISCFFQRGAVIFFATTSAVAWNYLFLKPHFTFMIEKLEDLLMFCMYFLTALIIGNLTTRLRKKEFFLRTRERILEELYRMSKILNVSNDIGEIIDNSITFLHEAFHLEFSFYLKNESNELEDKPCAGSDFCINERERKLASWSCANVKSAGRDTSYSQDSDLYYIPMKVRAQVIGVCIIRDSASVHVTLDNKNLLFTMILQIASAIERYELNKNRQKIEIAEESEKMHQILLNTVSHELRTPITTITNAGNGLLDDMLITNNEFRSIFVNDIIESSDRLNRIVDNLLGSIKIESGHIAPNLEWHDMSDIVNVVTRKLSKRIHDHVFVYSVKPFVKMVRIDFGLMEQLLTNLLYNSLLYTPTGSTIELEIAQDNENTVLSLRDNGPGIEERERDLIFQKFYRSRKNKKGGLGLGLSICKEIAEIHKGRIELQKEYTNGAHFVVTLPLEQSVLREIE